MRSVDALVLSLLTGLAAAQEPRDADAAKRTAEPRLIAFEKLDRTIARLPELTAPQPLYGLFLFGLHGEHRVWAVLDKSRRDAAGYDVLYLDRDADGDLTGAGERFAAKASEKGAEFLIGDFRDPGGDAVHTDFRLSWTPASVRYKLLWRGDKVTMGSYGPTRETYQGFAASPQAAPVFVPGYDRPFQFQHWMCDRLRRGQSTDFKVFVGNRGDRTGAFSCVDDDFLPAEEFVQATLLYRDRDGQDRFAVFELTKRC